LHQANFSEMEQFAASERCDGVLLDLGISSPQIDRAERGFSFQEAGPLDMRMNREDNVTAAQIVNTWSAEDLASLFWRLGEERESRRLARAIERRRKARVFSTTKDLADLIAAEMPRGGRKAHPATRVFQALRMEVNRELESLQKGLTAAWAVLKSTGRLTVITFHSLEDRMVKEFGRKLARDYEVSGEVDVPELRRPREPQARWVSRKAIVPSDEELEANPRARSAQLRVLEKL
jgi:16S rRNA (cytosine1402-N4)-methyltransferase